MKKIFFTLLCIITCSFCFSQTSLYQKGQLNFNIGVGFITPLFDVSGYDVKIKTPPVSITADYGLSDEIGVGIYIAKAKSDVYGTLTDLNSGYSYKDKQSTLTHFILGARVLYHFALISKLDTYGGAMLGYNSIKEKAEPNVVVYGNTETSGFTYSLLIGGRYRLTKLLGAFLELGYGVAVINLGINIRCK